MSRLHRHEIHTIFTSQSVATNFTLPFVSTVVSCWKEKKNSKTESVMNAFLNAIKEKIYTKYFTFLHPKSTHLYIHNPVKKNQYRCSLKLILLQNVSCT